jgi:hypothetical protein
MLQAWMFQGEILQARVATLGHYIILCDQDTLYPWNNWEWSILSYVTYSTSCLIVRECEKSMKFHSGVLHSYRTMENVCPKWIPQLNAHICENSLDYHVMLWEMKGELTHRISTPIVRQERRWQKLSDSGCSNIQLLWEWYKWRGTLPEAKQC